MWRVEFAGASVTSVTEVTGEALAGWFIVEADSESEARQLGARRVWRELARVRKARYAAEGKCPCGKPSDRDGKRLCSVCAMRRKQRRVSKESPELAPPPIPEVKQPGARLRTLIEVRQAWLRTNNVGAFSRWLASEIAALGGA